MDSNVATSPGAPVGMPALHPGDFVAGRYQIDGLAGEGGMAVVYSARHIHLAERYAIKVLRPGFAADKNVVSRFLQEARSAAQLRSDFACRVFDVALLPGGAPYIVMELLSGEDLAAVVRRQSTLPVDQALEFVIQACEALAEAHTLGLIHRDVKPENLFLTVRPDGWRTVKLLDFGISKILDPDSMETSLRKRFDTSDLLGTPHYMSPEQVRNAQDVDARSDLWSLGVVLYELLSGKLPFNGKTTPEVCAAILETDPVPLSELRTDIPPELADTVHWLLAKQPELRLSSAAELAVQLLPFAPKRCRAVLERMQSLARAQGEIIQVPASAYPPPGDVVASLPQPAALPAGLLVDGVEQGVAPETVEPPRRVGLWAAAIVFAFGAAAAGTWWAQAKEPSQPPESSTAAVTAAAPTAVSTATPTSQPLKAEAPAPVESPAPSPSPETEPEPEKEPARPARPGGKRVAPRVAPAKPPTAGQPHWDSGPDMGF